jgi:hypothetical protein
MPEPIRAACERTAAEFTAICREAVGVTPGEGGFVIEDVGWDGARPVLWYANPPRGPRIDAGRVYSVDRALVVEAAARFVAVRAGRWDAALGGIPLQGPGWEETLRGYFGTMFAGPLSCGAGWADLLWTLGEGLAVIGAADMTFRDVKKKMGTLSLQPEPHTVRTTAIPLEVVSAYSVLSWAVCETCGAPGRLRLARPWTWMVRCDKHSEQK